MIARLTAPPPPNVDSVNERLIELTRQVERAFAMLCALTERVAAIAAEPNTRRREDDEALPARPPGTWVSFKEASYLTGRSLPWLRKWRGRGEIAQHIEGGCILLNLEDAQRALVRHSRTLKTVRLSNHDEETPRSARPISRSPHRRRN
jgi:hypothetical protein